MADLLRSLARRALAAPTVRPRAPSRFEDGPVLETHAVHEAEAPTSPAVARADASAREATRPAPARDDREAPQMPSSPDEDRAATTRAARDEVSATASDRATAAPLVHVFVEQAPARPRDAADADARRGERTPRDDRDPVEAPTAPARATTERVVQEIHWHERLEQRTERLVMAPPSTAAAVSGATAAPASPAASARDESQRLSRADVPATPTVEIHIGRIDVRGAASPAPLAAPRAVAAPGPAARSLDEVLARGRSAA